jgi:type III pantothenate kinase
MLLAIDVGNTNVNAGLFSKGRLVKRFYFPGDIKEYKDKINKVIIVSVSPDKLKEVVASLRRIYEKKTYIIGRDIMVPLKSLYNQNEIGQDRLVTAYAASRLYGKPVLVIDFGTAITFDIVSKKNVYLGGLILPGIKMSLESLHKKTALLPEVELKKAKGFIGKNTETSIRNGMIYGYSAICGGLIFEFKKRFKNLKIIATGGNAKLVLSHTPQIKKIDEDLALKGLRLLA